MQQMTTACYRTAGGIQVHRAAVQLDYADALTPLVAALDNQPGVLLSSAFEYPGRYTRWDIGCVAPPLRISARGRKVLVEALNVRGRVLLPLVAALVSDDADYRDAEFNNVDSLTFSVCAAALVLVEEARTRQRSVFSFLRKLLQCFASPEDSHLGLYGAFGYELAFQFEPVRQCLPRNPAQRDLVLYLPDTLLVVDHRRETAVQLYYDFSFTQDGRSNATRHLPRVVAEEPFRQAPVSAAGIHSACPPGFYADLVRETRQYFARGDLFEAVPSQSFFSTCHDSPAAIFRRLQRQNPAPYGALLNLGSQEYLVAASPEMFVRVEGRRVESCPISGTIARGHDALEDAEQIRTLLNSEKDEAELSMCTDVDRNDKSRVCEAGSVKVLGRRQLELYSRLIHTVDHVEGTLKASYDALDAFLSHAWAVTVTGAPKQAAMQFIEEHERSPRAWYGGALGCLHFNGDLNTGLSIRTMQIREGVAEVRAGATLLFDSDPEAEERETRLKASALLHALIPDEAGTAAPVVASATRRRVAAPLRVLMVDHQDSFVHTLSGCFQQLGAEVVTVRPALVAAQLQQRLPQLVVLSPGPGRPQDFQVLQTLQLCLQQQLPVFGVCLGLQAIVEYFGGTLATLDYPVHGKAATLVAASGVLFEGIDQPIRVGRYHSLVAARVPECLQVCARTADGQVMAVLHRELPVAAVQFHPESLLSLDGGKGQALLGNALELLVPAWTAAVRSGEAA